MLEESNHLVDRNLDYKTSILYWNPILLLFPSICFCSNFSFIRKCSSITVLLTLGGVARTASIRSWVEMLQWLRNASLAATSTSNLISAATLPCKCLATSLILMLSVYRFLNCISNNFSMVCTSGTPI